MMDENVISQLSAVLRTAGDTIINGTGRFCISSLILHQFNAAFDNIPDLNELITPISHVTHSHPNRSNTVNIASDLHYINNFMQQTRALKVYTDSPPLGDDQGISTVDINKFRRITRLEIHKINVNTVRGLQKLRGQLQSLVCLRGSCDNLGDVLTKCGGDNSQGNCWCELKEANFSNNLLVQLDSESLENAPWLHTLDLSHNQITNADCLSCLTNLKHLNLGYNRLERVPELKGHICNNMQNLIVKNNFIETITGLQSLSNLCVLDMSNNTLINHKCLVSISHLATLQWLNLDGNPLSYHPRHRIQTVGYLHNNTKTVRFKLDYVVLDKKETKLSSTLHLMQTRCFVAVGGGGHTAPSSLTDSMTSYADRMRKARVVDFEPVQPIAVVAAAATPPSSTQASSQPHLDTKKQIERLRQQYGEFWLHRESASVVQSVLGLEPTVSSTPVEEEQSVAVDKDESTSADATTPLDFSNNIFTLDQTVAEESSTSDEDIDLDGEESMYLAKVYGEDDEIFVVTTETHLSEKECSTCNERVRWHINSIIECHLLEDDDANHDNELPKRVQLDFETMRKDRKQRVYEMDEKEIEKFCLFIRNVIATRVECKKRIAYLCMKCSAQFSKSNRVRIGQAPTTCPKCDSTLVVEDL